MAMMNTRPPTSTNVQMMFVHIDWRMPQKFTSVMNPRNDSATTYHGQWKSPAAGTTPTRPSTVFEKTLVEVAMDVSPEAVTINPTRYDKKEKWNARWVT